MKCRIMERRQNLEWKDTYPLFTYGEDAEKLMDILCLSF